MDDFDTVPVDYQPDFGDAPVPKAGQTVAPQNVLGEQRGIARGVTSTLGEATGIPDALKAWRGEMTPDEAQMFALGALPGLIPGAKAEEAAAEAAPAVAKAIRAYHGSPYDFDKFDLSKIGTGEGAQAYGHGLYFAEAEPVAYSYRFNQAPPYLKNGADSFARQAASLAQDAGLTGDEAKQYATDILHKKAMELPASGRRPWFDAINNYDTLIGNPATPGHMYEVNINADPEHFLDWDKPLSEQSEHVKNALKQTPWGLDYVGSHNLTGGQIAPSSPEGVQQLRELGIPGIKYLDQGSRGAGQYFVGASPKGGFDVTGPGNISHGNFDTREAANAFADQKNKEGQTSNYVVFSDDIVKIIRKYGLAGLIAGGAAHFSTTPVDHDPFQ